LRSELHPRAAQHGVDRLEVGTVAGQIEVAVAGVELGRDRVEVLDRERAERDGLVAVRADVLAIVAVDREGGRSDREPVDQIAELGVAELAVVAAAVVEVAPARGAGDAEAAGQQERGRAVDLDEVAGVAGEGGRAGELAVAEVAGVEPGDVEVAVETAEVASWNGPNCGES
jgi:hypothetical protein